MSWRMLLILAVWLVLSVSVAATSPQALTGDWVMADGSAIVRLHAGPDGETLSATVVSLLRPRFGATDPDSIAGEPRRDVHNPDPALRGRPLEGLQIADDLSRDGDDWKGTIYDPGSGRSYRCRLTRQDDNYLKVRGYVGFTALGRTMYWQLLPDYRRQVQRMFSAVDDRGDSPAPLCHDAGLIGCLPHLSPGEP